MAKWEPGFPEISRARLELWGLLPGPKDQLSPGTEAGPQPEVSEELTNRTGARHIRALPGCVCCCRIETGRRKAGKSLGFPQALFNSEVREDLSLCLIKTSIFSPAHFGV